MTANDDLPDSLEEADELLEDDRPDFPTCGKLSFDDRNYPEDVDVELASSHRSRSTTSLDGSSVCEGTEESRQQRAENHDHRVPRLIVPKIIGAEVVGHSKQHVVRIGQIAML
jgi:hypothetical protein